MDLIRESASGKKAFYIFPFHVIDLCPSRDKQIDIGYIADQVSIIITGKGNYLVEESRLDEANLAGLGLARVSRYKTKEIIAELMA